MRRTFSQLSYLSLAAIVALAVFGIIVFAARVPYTITLFENPGISFLLAVRLTVGLFVFSLQNMSLASLLHAAVTSLLIGINAALLAFYVRRFGGVPSSGSVASGTFGSVLALAISFFGFGCLSCGSVFFAALFTALGGAGLIAAVPYFGFVASALGIGLLILSVVFLARAINKPPVCPT
ncbi:MAG: hypothetical protein B7W98_00500 [Parcubacteria group bacterium 20-58-5]|nr:MAG: hypothetical protein B7W98_00500 [Parcubacteria group bacterium 20-58-5]OYV63497.1 MAG: hypothetical protein B7X03_01625 [Parcubacteria group bacterium 21-58-10]OYV83141.1 MAG: hypothetical protein B7W96_00590 [Parcubacteria group bacterium 37-58-5]HQT82673.1 hypothetical protein [Candidatus Paceibacterota bacterium]